MPSKKISMKQLAKQVGAGGKVIVVPMKHVPNLVGRGGADGEGEKKKRALTAYNKFIKAHMAEVKASEPKGKTHFKTLGTMWRGLTKEQQASYK